MKALGSQPGAWRTGCRLRNQGVNYLSIRRSCLLALSPQPPAGLCLLQDPSAAADRARVTLTGPCPPGVTTVCSCLHQESCPAAFPRPGGPVRGHSLLWGPLQPEDSVPSLEWWPVPREKVAAAHPARPCGPPRPLRAPLRSLSSSLPSAWCHHRPLPPAHLLGHQPGACPVSCSPHQGFSPRVCARWDVSRPCSTAVTSPGCDAWPWCRCSQDSLRGL